MNGHYIAQPEHSIGYHVVNTNELSVKGLIVLEKNLDTLESYNQRCRRLAAWYIVQAPATPTIDIRT